MSVDLTKYILLAYALGHAQLCVCIRPCRHYTEHGLRINRGNTYISSSDRDATQPLPLRNRECGKLLNISWNDVNLTHANLPVYTGVTLDRTLSFEAHTEKSKKVGTSNNIIAN